MAFRDQYRSDPTGRGMNTSHTVESPAVNSGRGAERGGRDVMGHRAAAEGAHAGVSSAGVTAERDRGYLSGDGQMHSR